MGAGGVGGYFGGRLAQAGADVHFIARGAQLQALREHGLTEARTPAVPTNRERSARNVPRLLLARA
jgi:ketopantoate reductase